MSIKMIDGVLIDAVTLDGVQAAALALSSNIIVSTRSLATESGDVGYTGAGFQPTSVIALVYKTGTNLAQSVGQSDDDGDCVCTSNYFQESQSGGAYLIAISDGTASPTHTGQVAIIKTYDADGFTLTWTKHGTPTGTAQLYFLCFK